MFGALQSSPCSPVVSHTENTFTLSHTHKETNKKTLHVHVYTNMYICMYSLALFYTWLVNYLKKVLCLHSTKLNEILICHCSSFLSTTAVQVQIQNTNTNTNNNN